MRSEGDGQRRGEVQEDDEQVGEAWGERERGGGEGHSGWGGMSYSDRVRRGTVDVKGMRGDGWWGLVMRGGDAWW